MDLPTVQSMDWVFQNKQLYFLAQYLAQVGPLTLTPKKSAPHNPITPYTDWQSKQQRQIPILTPARTGRDLIIKKKCAHHAAASTRKGLKSFVRKMKTKKASAYS